MSIFAEENFHGITEAAEGKHGADQERIAIEGLRWLDLLLRKNRDYGSAVWKPPVLTPLMSPASAILVRMSDKVNRIAQLTQAEAAVATESLDDSMRDLGAYCILYLARPK